MAFGDHFDFAIDHGDGGLIVKKIHWPSTPAANLERWAREASGIEG